MELSKKQIKENKIIDAAIELIAEVGYRNAKMDDISKHAGITKVTLYSYFQSKENLYLAIAYRAIQALSDVFYASIDRSKEKSGLEGVISIFESFFIFCEQNFLYSEAILDYFSMIRNFTRGSVSEESSKALLNSIYFTKIQDLQNLPLKLTVKEIQRGQRDGSIRTEADPMLHALQGWTMVVGYVKLLVSSGTADIPLFNFDSKSLKNLSLATAREFLRSGGSTMQ